MANIADKVTRRNRRRGGGLPMRRNRISVTYTQLLNETVESPAWRVLSLSARRVLDRVQAELGHHGGKDSDRLPVSYDDFEKFGIDRHSIGPAIREAMALGFLKVTRRGVAGNAEHRQVSYYQLTYARTADGIAETHDWRKFKTIAKAKAAAREARASVVRKNRKPVGENPLTPVGENPLKTSKSIVENPPLRLREKPPLLSISASGMGGREVALGGAGGRHSVAKPIGTQQTNSPILTSQTNNPIGISQTNIPIEPNRRFRRNGVR
jgi:hypothetical protein